MWRCANCGTFIEHGAVCAACGRPIDEAFNAIRRKVRSVRLSRNLANQWRWRGAKTGFVFGSILTLILAAILVVRYMISSPRQGSILDIFAIVIVIEVSQAVILWPLLFAIIFLIYGSIIKPVWIALFCSVERFEQEYGPPRK